MTSGHANATRVIATGRYSDSMLHVTAQQNIRGWCVHRWQRLSLQTAAQRYKYTTLSWRPSSRSLVAQWWALQALCSFTSNCHCLYTHGQEDAATCMLPVAEHSVAFWHRLWSTPEHSLLCAGSAGGAAPWRDRHAGINRGGQVSGADTAAYRRQARGGS
jgi:hypothetical protein